MTGVTEIAEMPCYRMRATMWSEVHALKIVGVGEMLAIGERQGARILMFEGDYTPITVGPGFVHDYNPMPGGYFIIRRGGGRAFSPAEIFERDYILVD